MLGRTIGKRVKEGVLVSAQEPHIVTAIVEISASHIVHIIAAQRDYCAEGDLLGRTPATGYVIQPHPGNIQNIAARVV